MSSAAQRAELQSQIWKIANEVRGSVDGWDFKQYVLGTLFYRFISENFSNYMEGGDDSINYAGLDDTIITKEIKEDAVKTKGYFIYPSQLFCRIAENENVLLPLMVCQDGFITSHSIENIELLEDEKVKEFVGEYHPEHYLLNKEEPIAVGPLDVQSYLFEHKAAQADAMRNAKQVILDVAKDFEKMTGRKYSLFEEYKLDDAEIAIVCMNSTAGTTKFVVDKLREQGIKAGLLKLRVFRPFPVEEIAKALSHLKAIAVLDKADSLNAAGGALFTDITSAMQVNGVTVPTSSYVYGIGGRDTTTKEIESVYNDLMEDSKKGKIENPYRYLGLRKE